MEQTGNGVTFAQLTTMRVGGAPERVVVAETREELIAQASELIASGEDWMPLGGGSNTIMSDDGFPGTLLLIRSAGFAKVPDETIPAGSVRIRVQAGQDWNELITGCLERGFLGLEALAGIPGAAGAAPIQNIGAYGVEIKDFLHSIEFLDSDTGELIQISAEQLGFAYRDSAIKRQELSGVVVSIDLVLKHANNQSAGGEARTTVNHGQLAAALGCEIGDSVSAHEIRTAVIALRKSKGMVLDEADHDSWSSGSFFTNPIVTTSFARGLPVSAPKYPVDAPAGEEPASKDQVIPLSDIHLLDQLQPIVAKPSFTKVSAAWLIEKAGVQKGYSIPGSRAAISSKHTLAITNRGGASAEEVAELARYVMARVRSEFGIVLVPEPNLYGIAL